MLFLILWTLFLPCLHAYTKFDSFLLESVETCLPETNFNAFNVRLASSMDDSHLSECVAMSNSLIYRFVSFSERYYGKS